MAFALRDGILKELCRDAEAQPDRRPYLIFGGYPHLRRAEESGDDYDIPTFLRRGAE